MRPGCLGEARDGRSESDADGRTLRAAGGRHHGTAQALSSGLRVIWEQDRQASRPLVPGGSDAEGLHPVQVGCALSPVHARDGDPHRLARLVQAQLI
jgi:hypothetical protein